MGIFRRINAVLRQTLGIEVVRVPRKYVHESPFAKAFPDGSRRLYQDKYLDFGIAPGSRVLDIGSGNAPFREATVLCDRYPHDTVHRRGRFRTGNRSLVVADIAALPFRDGAFAFVYTAHVLEHVDDPYTACQELMRVAPRGYLETPNFMKDALFCQAAMMHHRWHTVAAGGRLYFFEYTTRQVAGLRSTAWSDLVWSDRYHPLQEAFVENQDLFNTMFLWDGPFEVEVVKNEAPPAFPAGEAPAASESLTSRLPQSAGRRARSSPAPLRVAFLFQGLPHYYNYVLNRLHACPEVEVLNVVPVSPVHVGEGVYQTHEDIEYELRELEEVAAPYGGYAFPALWKLLWRERPDLLVVSEAHLPSMLYDLRVCLVRWLLGIRLVLKSIPFRTPTYPELKQEYRNALSCRLRELSDRRGLPGSGDPPPQPLQRCAQALLATRRQWLLSLKARVGAKWRPVERKVLLRLPAGHVCYVEAARTIYGSYGVRPERVFVIGNSPDTDRLLEVNDRLLNGREALARRPHRLIHVGRLVAWKRVDLLLAAVSTLTEKYPDLELLVVGAGPKEDEWRRLAQSLGVSAHVQFLGGVYDIEDLGRLYLSSSVYVLAGMGGISINEAMCFGLPIVCSVCDGTERVLVRSGENGVFFRQGDAADLAEKLDTLLERPELCHRLGENSRRIIREEINIHTVIERYLHAFQWVVRGGAQQ